MAEGEAVQILIPKEKNSFELDKAALERILLQDDIKNKNVVVISVAGAFRKGKSFLLGFLLRYLSSKGVENWMGNPDQPLIGFNWKASRDRVTTGILMWSKPFFMKLASGQEVAVLLMDTQGTFDSKSTEKENSTVFALSAMLSSILIYNISENLYECDLLHLQRFAEYGKLALENTVTPFQKLVFLVRDYPLAREWGEAGGRNLLEERMQAESEELRVVRDLIKASFSERSCYLMPPPGKAVTSKEDFDGKLQDIDEDFRDHLKTFVSDLLSPKNLIVKNISGNNVTAKNLLQYFCSYMDIFASDIMPTPKNILLGVIECDNVVALANAKEHYLKKMEEVSESIGIDDTDDEQQRQKLETAHEEIKTDVLKLFDGMKKTGGNKYSKKYRDALIQYIDEQYVHVINMIQNKTALRSAVKQTESLFKKRMDELFGISTPPTSSGEIENHYMQLVEEAEKQYFATADALIKAENLTPLYKEKLSKGLEEIYKEFLELNEEKSTLSQMTQEVIHEFTSRMQQLFGADANSVPVPEFLQSHMQIRSEAMKKFDSGRCSYRVTSFFKEKLEREIQDIVFKYEESNNQKLYCERCIEKIIADHKVDWNGNHELSTDKAKQKLRKMVGQNWFQIYSNKLEQKLNDWWSYERFVSAAKSLYETCMRDIINPGSRKVSEDEADRQHAYSKSKAVDSLEDDIRKLEGAEEYVGYAKQLDEELEYLYLYYKGLNEGKNEDGCIIL